MRVTFLGTGAAECYPGRFCECENCRYAREKGGRNLRANTATLIDSDTLLDMTETCFQTAQQLGISLAQIRNLLITHPHEDHFSPYALGSRRETPGAHALTGEARSKALSPRFVELPLMTLYGNRFTMETLRRKTPDILENPQIYAIAFHEIWEGVTAQAENLRYTPVRARHVGPGFTHSYILERDAKTLLYATDTGGYDDDMLEVLLRFRYDCVVMEGTFGLGADYEYHMNLEKNRAFLRFLAENGLWKGERRFVLTHMSPHWTPPYDVYAPMMEKEGITVAYDGMQIEL